MFLEINIDNIFHFVQWQLSKQRLDITGQGRKQTTNRHLRRDKGETNKDIEILAGHWDKSKQSNKFKVEKLAN